MSGAREVVFEFVEGTGHNSVGEVEGFFHTIAVVDIDIDIEHSLESFQELEDSQHAIVDIAEPGGLGLFGVVESPGPVDSVLVFAIAEQGCAG
jgi:hypothetical protein